MKTLTRTTIAGAIAAGCVSLAQAHPGHDGPDLTWDFQSGFAHPFTGLDHILTMVAIGWWAVQLGGRARWLVPGVFLLVMTASAAMARGIVPPPGLEQAIAASVVLSGLFLAVAVRMRPTLAAVIVGAFAAFHGLAHGAEMPASASALDYGAGFVASTAVLLAVGGAAGWAAKRVPQVARVAGAVGCLVGVVLLFA
ncbi:MAG TPA: HupE/UreJ family protein [Opitutaceae bacterium]|nr:HupE/UreJ family protein [Opitutaceae bacterium]